MITVCKFDKNKDFQETVPDLEISIEMALTTGIVKDTATSTVYNKMTSTDQVGGYLHDAIDIALEARRVGAAMYSAQPTSTDYSGNTEGAS